MKKYNFIILVTVFLFLCNGSCEYKERQRFIIHNNSNKEIIVMLSENSSMEHKEKFCIKQLTGLEYGDFIRYYMIASNSYKNLEQRRIGERVLERPVDTLYVGVFNRIDMDTMSCGEFKQKYPLKKEWKVTLADMEACDWTLVYEPEE